MNLYADPKCNNYMTLRNHIIMSIHTIDLELIPIIKMDPLRIKQLPKKSLIIEHCFPHYGVNVCLHYCVGTVCAQIVSNMQAYKYILSCIFIYPSKVHFQIIIFSLVS